MTLFTTVIEYIPRPYINDNRYFPTRTIYMYILSNYRYLKKLKIIYTFS